MGAKGITKQIVVETAIKCIEETECGVVSMHEIARRLGVKTPSLYNHIKGNKELQYEVFQYAIDKFVINQQCAVADRTGDDAVKAFARAYYRFAAENKGLYRLIMSIPSEQDERAKEMAVPLLDTVVTILSDYGLEPRDIAHWQRVFRAMLHGFISEEDLGYFYYYKDVDLAESREIAVQCFLQGLHALCKK